MMSNQLLRSAEAFCTALITHDSPKYCAFLAKKQHANNIVYLSESRLSRTIKASEHKHECVFGSSRKGLVVCLCSFLIKFAWLDQNPLIHSVVENCINLEAISPKICSSGSLH